MSYSLQAAAILEKRRRAGTWNPTQSHEYGPRGKATRAQAAEESEIILTGPRGTGKSRAWLEKLYHCALEYAGFRGLIVRRVRRDLAETALLTFERDVLGSKHPLVLNGPTRPHRTAYRFDNGSIIVCEGMDRPARVLSAEYDLIYAQQAEEFSAADWEAMFGCLRAWTMPYQQIGGDCNPQSPQHWIKQRQKQGLLELWETYHEDNPRLWTGTEWTEEGSAYLAQLDRLTGYRKQRQRYGLWVAPEGAIYEILERVGEYGEKVHVVKGFPIPALWPRFVGVDPIGAEVAAVWVALDPEAAIANVYREYSKPFGPTTPEHVSNILKLSSQETVFAWVGGSKSERQAREDWRAAGIPLQEPPISDVWAGVDRIKQLFDDFAMVIHENCVDTISDLTAYRRKLKGGEMTEQIEDKGKFHRADALRYVIAWITQPQERAEIVYRPFARRW